MHNASTRQHWNGFWDKQCYLLGLKSTEGLQLPDFLGIGAVKAGTTWLYRCLYNHPALFLPVKKPVFYFDKNFHKPLADYARIFRRATGKTKGEITASYSTLPLGRIRFIRRIIPELKIIFLMRQPIHRDWSDARMELTVIQEKQPDAITHQDLVGEIESRQCRDRGNYLQILQNWCSVFPREQFLIGTYEDMFSRPKDFLKEVFSFLGVSTEIDWEKLPIDEFVFRGAGIQMPDDIRQTLQQRYPPARIQELGRFLDLDLADTWNLTQP